MNQKLYKYFGDSPIIWVACWGISKLRKRSGRFAGAIEGEAVWFDEWHERMLSNEMLDYLQELGVNLITLPFSVGGDQETEKAERDDFQRVTGELHTRGMVSLPYLQYQNILQEAYQYPHIRWSIPLNGGRKSFAYWRRTPCQSSKEFIDYFKLHITDAMERGGDGIWIDNTHLLPCRCEQCHQEFRQWLSEHRPSILEHTFLKNFNQVEMPPDNEHLRRTFDPIIRALNDYSGFRNSKILRAFKSHMTSLNADALFASNPGIDRGNSGRQCHAKGIDYLPFMQLHDLIYLENKYFPSQDATQTTGNYHAINAALHCGSTAIPAGWKRSDFDSTKGTTGEDASGFPSTEEEIRRYLFESSTFGGVLGMLWAIRSCPADTCKSEADLMKAYLELPFIEGPTKKTLTFLKSLPVFGMVHNPANIVVLRHRESLAYHADFSFPSLHMAEELLLRNGFPYDNLFSEEFAEKAHNYNLILLPDVTVLSDQDAKDIENYVAQGGRILVLGNTGIYTSEMQTRKDYALRSVIGRSRFVKNEQLTYHDFGKGRSACLLISKATDQTINHIMYPNGTEKIPEWYQHTDILLGAIDDLLGKKRQVVLEQPKVTAVSLKTPSNGETCIHLLSYAKHLKAKKVCIRINKDLISTPVVEWFTPDAQPQIIKGEMIDNHIRFELEGFFDYGVIIPKRG